MNKYITIAFRVYISLLLAFRREKQWASNLSESEHRNKERDFPWQSA